MRSVVLLECARFEEYCHHLDRARAILRKAKIETKHEWKVFLESVLLEIRMLLVTTVHGGLFCGVAHSNEGANNIPGALREAEAALQIHSGTGRLWAVMIQLKQFESYREQLRVFRKALHEVLWAAFSI